jgi:hypothetical protein
MLKWSFRATVAAVGLGARRGLGGRLDASAIVSGLASPTQSVRQQAVKSLTACGKRDAPVDIDGDVVAGLVKHKDAAVRNSATEALMNATQYNVFAPTSASQGGALPSATEVPQLDQLAALETTLETVSKLNTKTVRIIFTAAHAEAVARLLPPIERAPDLQWRVMMKVLRVLRLMGPALLHPHVPALIRQLDNMPHASGASGSRFNLRSALEATLKVAGVGAVVSHAGRLVQQLLHADSEEMRKDASYLLLALSAEYDLEYKAACDAVSSEHQNIETPDAKAAEEAIYVAAYNAYEHRVLRLLAPVFTLLTHSEPLERQKALTAMSFGGMNIARGLVSQEHVDAVGECLRHLTTAAVAEKLLTGFLRVSNGQVSVEKTLGRLLRDSDMQVRARARRLLQTAADEGRNSFNSLNGPYGETSRTMCDIYGEQVARLEKLLGD